MFDEIIDKINKEYISPTVIQNEMEATIKETQIFLDSLGFFSKKIEVNEGRLTINRRDGILDIDHIKYNYGIYIQISGYNADDDLFFSSDLIFYPDIKFDGIKKVNKLFLIKGETGEWLSNGEFVPIPEQTLTISTDPEFWNIVKQNLAKELEICYRYVKTGYCPDNFHRRKKVYIGRKAHGS
jgi:hypothetical protein